jgi:hypothetical protein
MRKMVEHKATTKFPLVSSEAVNDRQAKARSFGVLSQSELRFVLGWIAKLKNQIEN